MPKTFAHEGSPVYTGVITYASRGIRRRGRLPRTPDAIISGDKIARLETLGSQFDEGRFLNVYLDTGEKCRITTDELLKLIHYHLNDHQWRLHKKVCYRHLSILP